MKNKQVAPSLRFKKENGEDYPPWEQRNFYDCFKLLRNNTLARSELSKVGKIRNIHYGDVLINYPEVLKISTTAMPFIGEGNVSAISQESYLENGDIVIADTAEDESVGKAIEIQGITTHEVVSGLHTIPCRPQAKFSANFLGFLLNSPSFREQLKPLIQGVKVSSISKKALGETKLCFAKDLVEQEQIGNFLNEVEALITLHQRKVESVKKLKKSLLQKMFPKEGETVPAIRFPGFTDAWEQRELNTAATFLNGRAFSQSELLSKGKYPVLRVGNFYTNDKWYFSDLVLPEKFYATKGDLLYTWSATFGPHIWEGDKVIYHYHIWKLLLGKDTDKTFLLSLLQRDRETLLQGSNGSTMIHITKQAMEAKKLFFPRSQEEQRQIGSFFKTIDKAITLHQRKLESLQKLKKALLQRMFI